MIKSKTAELADHEVLNRQLLLEAIRNAAHDTTLYVTTNTVRELGEIAASSGRMNRPDLKFVIFVKPDATGCL